MKFNQLIDEVIHQQYKVTDIRQEHLGYPGCSGKEVPEPFYVCRKGVDILQISFDGKQDWGDVLCPTANIIEYNDSKIKYSIQYVIAATLVKNGVHYNLAIKWLNRWMWAILFVWKDINNIGKVKDFGGELIEDKEIYSERTNKSENAVAFLNRVYASEINSGRVTLSLLHKVDKSLSTGLRNWARAGGHDLDSIIPRGRNQRGPAPKDTGVDVSKLDPTHPLEALALQAIRRREIARESAKRRYHARRLAM